MTLRTKQFSACSQQVAAAGGPDPRLDRPLDLDDALAIRDDSSPREYIPISFLVGVSGGINRATP